MTIAFGQQSALRDLEAIAREGDALEIINVAEPKEEDGFLLAWISQIDPSGDWRSCDYYEYSDY